MYRFLKKCGVSKFAISTTSLIILSGCASMPTPQLYYDEDVGKPRIKLEGKSTFFPKTSGKINEKGEFLIKMKWGKAEFWKESRRKLSITLDRWFEDKPHHQYFP